MVLTTSTVAFLLLLTGIDFILTIIVLMIASIQSKKRQAISFDDGELKINEYDYYDSTDAKLSKKKKIAFIGKIQPGKRKEINKNNKKKR